jgi:Mg-chelatase subunit ChlD
VTSVFALRLTGFVVAVLLGSLFLFLIFNYIKSVSFGLPSSEESTEKLVVDAQLGGRDHSPDKTESRIQDSAESTEITGEMPSSDVDSDLAIDSRTKADGTEKMGELRLYASRNRPALKENGSGVNPFSNRSDTVKSVVFVIDVSGSMNSQGRLIRVKASLQDAIESLREDQEFNIVLFNDQYTSFSASQGLLRASSKRKREAYDYLSATFPMGGTNPLPAITSAIRCDPERIVVLSDGEFDPLVVEQATTLNQSRKLPAVIDCVGVDEQVEVLRQLATQNGGVYFQAK